MAAGEHRHRVEQRTGRGLVDEIRADHDQRPFHPADGAEREVVVAVDERRLDVEDRSHHRFAAGAPRREPAADLGVVDRDPAAVAELVGDERDHRDRVDGRVEPA